MTTTARPGRLTPEHLWLADDEDKLVVSVLAPEVAGAARHDTTGPVTIVTPCPVRRAGGLHPTRPAPVGLHTPRTGAARLAWAGTTGSAAAAAGGAWAAGPWAGTALIVAGAAVTAWQALRRYTRTAHRWAEGHQVLTRHEDRDVINRAAQNVRAIAASWPRLRTHVALDDPSPALVDQLWELTLRVSERATARQRGQDLRAAAVDVPTGSRVALELTDQMTQVDRAVARLDRAIDQRQADLWRLADHVHAFVTEQEMLARAHATTRSADQHRNVPSAEPGETATGELTDHTAAVLAAYRELTQRPALDGSSRP
ncbi:MULTISPECIES: hypothetical protein [Asanoa]|nr:MULTISPECIES: hypothetical protein [Asanoa]